MLDTQKQVCWPMTITFYGAVCFKLFITNNVCLRDSAQLHAITVSRDTSLWLPLAFVMTFNFAEMMIHHSLGGLFFFSFIDHKIE